MPKSLIIKAPLPIFHGSTNGTPHFPCLLSSHFPPSSPFPSHSWSLASRFLNNLNSWHPALTVNHLAYPCNVLTNMSAYLGAILASFQGFPLLTKGGHILKALSYSQGGFISGDPPLKGNIAVECLLSSRKRLVHSSLPSCFA